MNNEYAQKIWFSLSSEDKLKVHSWIKANIFLEIASPEEHEIKSVISEKDIINCQLPQYIIGDLSETDIDTDSPDPRVIGFNCRKCSTFFPADFCTGYNSETSILAHVITFHLPEILGRLLSHILDADDRIYNVHRLVVNEEYDKMIPLIYSYGPDKFFEDYDKWLQDSQHHGSEQAEYFYFATTKFMQSHFKNGLNLVTKIPATMYVAIEFYEGTVANTHLTNDKALHLEYIQNFLENVGYTSFEEFEKENNMVNKRYLEYSSIYPVGKTNCSMPENIEMCNVEFIPENLPDNELLFTLSKPLTDKVREEIATALAKIREDPEFLLDNVEEKIQTILKTHGYTIFPYKYEEVNY
jgi:hypothetical protein